jgi:cytochrome c biogenesis protein CcmG/thiol:disulfide interchange protein DsbE
MSLIPQVETALLEAVRRDQGRTSRTRPLARRAAATLVAVACIGTGAAAATGIWSNVRTAVRHGAQPPAPAASVPVLDARARASLAQFRGKIVLVSFWAAWCEPCIRQAPALATLNRYLHQTHTGTVLLVSTGDTPREATETLRREHLEVPVVTASPTEPGGRAFFRAFLGASSPLPVTFVVDRAGRVAGCTEGSASLKTLRSLIRRAES